MSHPEGNPIRAKPDTSERRATIVSAHSPAHLDPAAIISGRFAPKPDEVRQLLVDARARVASARPYRRDQLLLDLAAADPTPGLRAWYARRLLCRLLGEPNLPAWLDAPVRTRGDVLRLLIRAARLFGGGRRAARRVDGAEGGDARGRCRVKPTDCNDAREDETRPNICGACGLDPSAPEHAGRQIYVCDTCGALVCSDCSESGRLNSVHCLPCHAGVAQ